MLVAVLLLGESRQVLIRMPFVVPLIVQSLTTKPLTSPSFGYLPKLPTIVWYRKNSFMYKIECKFCILTEWYFCHCNCILVTLFHDRVRKWYLSRWLRSCLGLWRCSHLLCQSGILRCRPPCFALHVCRLCLDCFPVPRSLSRCLWSFCNSQERCGRTCCSQRLYPPRPSCSSLWTSRSAKHEKFRNQPYPYDS